MSESRPRDLTADELALAESSAVAVEYGTEPMQVAVGGDVLRVSASGAPDEPGPKPEPPAAAPAPRSKRKRSS